VAAPTLNAKKTGPREGKLEQRCQRFVEVAEQLFLDKGYDGTSVNEVVRVAGGSLATLYAEFGTKEALFEAVMQRRAAALFIDMGSRKARAGGVRSELLQLATRMQEHMLSDRALAFYRLAVHEGPKFPSVRKAVLETGLKGFLGHLADYLAALAASGRVKIGDAGLASEDFLTLVQGQHRIIAACGNGAHLTRKRREDHVKHAVDCFLRIYPAGAVAK
jgi:TetR/AcrR family transcriptional repressor of cmeABC operon